MATNNNNVNQAAGGGAIGKLIANAKSDPRKAGILTVLVIALGVLVFKRLSDHGPGPALALGANAAEATGGSATTRTSAKEGVGAFEEWRSQPITTVNRNLFAVNLDMFPQDGIRAAAVRAEGDGFWDQVAKSMSNRADARTKRQTYVVNMQAEAAKLRLQSTVMGAQPKALINGDLVREGDVVASFRVLKIEARRIIVEREGIKLEIQMN
jgi:hypothetical protein